MSEASEAWRSNLGPCQVCPEEGGVCSGPVQPHHVTEARTLRKRGYHDHLYDTRNRLPVCEYRHEQHTSAYRRIPRRVVPPAAWEFARELDLEYLILRYYPEEDS